MGYWSDESIRQEEEEIRKESMRRKREAAEQTASTGHYVDEYDIEIQEEWERVKDRD